MLGKHGYQFVIGFIRVHAILFGIMVRKVFEPKMIIEIEIQQGAVHIQQHRINFIPGQKGQAIFLIMK